MAKASHYILRIGLGCVFVWFGYSGITNTDMWIRLVPDWANAVMDDAHMLVLIHGAFELTLGLLLIAGLWTRVVAGLLCLSLVHTIFLVSGPTLIRDLGILAGLLSLAFDPRR